MRKKFYITTLGCKVNQYDSESIKRKLISLGFDFRKDNPDLVIINTCAVTKTAIKKGRRIFNALKKRSPDARFVLMGCFPQTYHKQANELDVDLTWGTGKKHELIAEILKISNVRTYVRTSSVDPIEKPGSRDRSRYFIKIQDGCEQFCSYCNIPFARGKMVSRKKQEVVDEVEAATKAGYGEIVLCGIHLGLYGKEKNSDQVNLVGLLKELTEITGLGRIRLSSIEINDIDHDLVELMKSSKQICNHLHLPLQSGSDKILKMMNRPYKTSFFEKQVAMVRELIPGIAITTDVIVGFPGESKYDFEQTKKFVEKIKFSRLHVFPFSVHEKTAAAKMKPFVDSFETKRRAMQMREVGKLLEKNYLDQMTGIKKTIAVEKVINQKAIGIDEYYIKTTKKIFDGRMPAIGSLL